MSAPPALAPPTLKTIPDGVPNRGPLLFGVYVGMIVPATVIVAVRLGWKYTQPKGLGLDDLFIFIAILLDWAHTGMGIATVKYGFGHHAVDIPRPDLRKAIMLWYACQIIYKMLVAFTKMAITALYLRLFPQKWLKTSAWTVTIVTFVGSLAFAIASIFECNPIHKTWDRSQPGTCYNLGASWYAYAAFNSLLDIIIILMPLGPIWTLQLKPSQKAGLAGIFLTGAFVCFTSIMRIVSLPASAKSNEPTWGSVDAVTWAEIEGGVGIITACLPALRAPLIKLYRVSTGKGTETGSRSRMYNRSHSGYHDADKRPGPMSMRTSRVDYWGDSIPLSMTEAQANLPSDGDSEERVKGGITKTVHVHVSEPQQNV